MKVYTDYIRLYEHHYETIIPHKQFILNLVQQWQVENLPPNQWRQWVKDNKRLFKSLNVQQESLVFLNDFLYFVEETYARECRATLEQSWRYRLHKWWTGLIVELNQIFKKEEE